jgi:crotonobetainyl-CoA:carnitine CoA-transferase CaiB-like acyl-CoA transferase
MSLGEPSAAVTDGRAPVLQGVRVIDLGHALAAPFAATMLADFGAEVLKIERPGSGDPMRRLGLRKNDVPLWWKAAGRNKKSVTLDFSSDRGRDILLNLVERSDVLVENFRPGTLERRRLGWDVLRERNPGLVMLRVSGFGQTGPHRDRPGFGRTAEAMSGAAQLTGFPDGAPVHVGYSLADTLSGLMGAWGVLLGLLGRAQNGEGEVVDVALYEPLFRLIDWQVTVHDQLGIVPERAGNAFPAPLQGVAAGVARSLDGVWLSYSAATDTVLLRVIKLVFGEDAERDPRFADVDARRHSTGAVQEAVQAWVATRSADDVQAAFADSHAVIGPVYDMNRIANDPAFVERGNIIRVPDSDFGEVAMHGVVPKLTVRPGAVNSVGPQLGEHTEEVLTSLGGVSPDEIDDLRSDGVI